MTLLIDATPLVALADSSEPLRDQILECLETESGALIIPAPITAEIDYLLGQRLGGAARRAFLADLAAGRFLVENLEEDDYATALALEDRYADSGGSTRVNPSADLRRAALSGSCSSPRRRVLHDPARRRLIDAEKGLHQGR